jgi:hypothetical protein
MWSPGCSAPTPSRFRGGDGGADVDDVARGGRGDRLPAASAQDDRHRLGRRHGAVVINQLDVVVRGEATAVLWVKSAVTSLVPFCVAYAGVQAASHRAATTRANSRLLECR